MPLAVRLHRPGDDRRRRSRRRRCAPCRSCSGSPTACASSRADGAWIVDFTNPVGIVTRVAARRRPSRGRSLQRRDRLPAAAFARLLGVEPERVRDRPGRAQPPLVGALRAARRRGRAAGAARGARRRARRQTRASPRGCSTSSALVPSYYLHYFYAHDAVLAEQLEGVPRAATVAEIERELLRDVPRPERSSRSRRCSSSAAARSTARRRSGWSASLAGGHRRRARRRRAQRRHARRARRRRRRRGAGARVGADGATPLAAAAGRARAARADPARRGLRAACRARGGQRRPRRSRARRCSRIR